MAKVKAKKSNQAAHADPVVVKVGLDLSADYPTYHANFADVAHAPYEFSLIFARLSPRMPAHVKEAAKASGVLPVAPEVHVVIPPEVVPGLIRALQQQQERFEAQFGSIVERAERNPQS